MQQGDYSRSNPYYHYPQNPNPASAIPSPPSYASAPPFAATYPSSSDYSSSYPPPYTHNPDLLSTYYPPPPPAAQAPAVQQPQHSSSFPSFESQQPHYNPSPTGNTPYPSIYPTPNYDNIPKFDQNKPYFDDKYGNYGSRSAEYTNAPKFDQNKPYFDDKYGNYGSMRADYSTAPKFDQNGPYFDESVDKYGNYGPRRGELGLDSYGNDGYGEGVVAYQGSSKVEPYGARGTGPKSSTWSGFDDFGRPIGYNNSSKGGLSGSSAKIVKAIPKADTQEDAKSGVQKFRVKLLAESGGQSTQDVLCQIGLDGIRMLDPSTSRTLRIYPLDTVTRCDKTDSSTFAFWSKSAVDIEPRRIRLQSNSYTTSTLLDTVTAATVQFKEMGGRIRPSDSPKVAEQPTEKKKGFADWINIVKPINEEKDHWVPDEAVSKCTACGSAFNAFVRKHHCRNCGDIFCDKCTQGRTALTADENAPVVRVCDRCVAEVSRRLNSAKDAANRSSTGLQSHEDLTKKLQEELERNRRESSGSRSDRSGRMKEVACPTCTVHLQVEVPSSGSETIECGVCQHPFLVSSH